MEKRSVFTKLIILVMIALLVPIVSSAGVVCEPPYCGPCSANQYICTDEWIWASWHNMYAAMLLWAAGYTVTVCCE